MLFGCHGMSVNFLHFMSIPFSDQHVGTDYDWALVNVKLKLVVGILINKLSLIWPISLYTGLVLLFCINSRCFCISIIRNCFITN